MIKISNKKLGNDWEKECLYILGENNFFATKLQEKSMGAPFDLVATKNNIFYAIECKEILKGSKFDFNRIESNQKTSYQRLLKVKSNNYYFLFKCEFGNFVFHANDILLSKNKSVDVKNGENLENWLLKHA